MSKYYKANRNPGWNYGGSNWKLSRSKIDAFLKCPRCFYIDNKLGTAQPPGYPLTLNVAVDGLLKKEFDIHRAKKAAHPMMEHYGIDAIPFEHPDMDSWRDNFTGVQYVHPATNFLVSGAVDDVWVNPAGDLIVVDYKATAKKDAPSLDGDLGAQYIRQMEIYQWLLKNNGFKVSPRGYFVYVNGKKDAKAFDGKLEFEISVLPADGETSWIDPVIERIKKALDSDSIPDWHEECDYCAYFRARSEHEKKSPVLETKKAKGALF
ncbi:MAG: PD-(D/E)XK nuclease family protein [Candidatus Harrisonbacteria bacterium]|nr:PD-(D/E)XK nuclease family protein [Candidatus Harrisonbacteria bacterium]